MNFSIIFSLILIILGIITSLSGSELFWWIIILFPILILIRTRKKIDISYVIILIILYIFFGIGLMDEGLISIGDLIVLIYLGLIIFVGGILFGLKEYKGGNISPLSAIGLMIAIVGTIIISSNMPTPLPIIQSNNTVPVVNTGSKSTTGMISTGITYPLIIK